MAAVSALMGLFAASMAPWRRQRHRGPRPDVKEMARVVVSAMLSTRHSEEAVRVRFKYHEDDEDSEDHEDREDSEDREDDEDNMHVTVRCWPCKYVQPYMDPASAEVLDAFDRECLPAPCKPFSCPDGRACRAWERVSRVVFHDVFGLGDKHIVPRSDRLSDVLLYGALAGADLVDIETLLTLAMDGRRFAGAPLERAQRIVASLALLRHVHDARTRVKNFWTKECREDIEWATELLQQKGDLVSRTLPVWIDLEHPAERCFPLHVYTVYVRDELLERRARALLVAAIWSPDTPLGRARLRVASARFEQAAKRQRTG